MYIVVITSYWIHSISNWIKYVSLPCGTAIIANSDIPAKMKINPNGLILPNLAKDHQMYKYAGNSTAPDSKKLMYGFPPRLAVFNDSP